tara:strand:+ start:334 stop:1506 length:1173 start_codon:yes stop_codon:yes gene_type:complete
MGSLATLDSKGFNASRVTLTLGIAGVVGGLLGFGLGEIQIGDDGSRFFSDSVNAGSAVYFSLVLLGVGAALVASQGISQKNAQKAAETVLRSLPAILIGGAVAGFVAQILYTEMLNSDEIDEAIRLCSRQSDYACTAVDNLVRPARAIGWMIAGGLSGLALGIGFQSKKRMQNGVIGGAVGGLIGGLLFDSVDNIIGSGSAQPSRLVALLLIGALMGALIGLVDTLRTDMWLTVTSGEMTGQQFIIYDETTIVGCARNVPITILADRDVAEHHISISRVGGVTTFQCLPTASPITVNGSTSTSGSLSNGDIVTVGSTELRVGERTADSSSTAAPAATGQAHSDTTSRPDLYSHTPESKTPSSDSAPVQPSRSQPPPAPKKRPTIQMKPKD